MPTDQSAGKILGQAGFEQRSNVSRETLADYIKWQALLRKWSARINLVAPSTLDMFWERHALDSWQICPLLSDDAKILLDFGSGAGFPGLAAAIHIKHHELKSDEARRGRQVHLVESVGKKASFLKTVTRELGLPARIHNTRIEQLPAMKADVITARAFAPLPSVFDYALPHIHAGTTLILLKGENAARDIENAQTTWTFTLESVKSITQDNASVLIIKNLARKA